ncbi:MAG: hypothetical protein KC613_26140, partial [Myxococcales bacterium]|nr:hypothetical protein [Myxococcales bacterium]
LALPLGCHPEPPRPVPDTGLPTPQVELGGAARVEPAAGGPVPVFGPKHLPVVWVDAQGVEAQSPLAMAWRAEGTSALPVTTVPIQGGNRLTVAAGPSVPEGDGALVLTLAGREVWSTAARWASGPEPNWPEVEAARAAARRGDPEAAATAWLSAVELVPPTHSERTRRRIAAAHSLWAIGDFERALQVLEAAPAPIPLLEAERLRTRSVLHRSLGQFRPAERELDQVERLSERFNLALVAHLARESRALLLDELGRAAEAVAVIESAAPYARRQGGQALARWRANRGWLHLRAWTPGPTSQGLQRARADLSAALEWDWPGPTRANILSSLAWLELLEARPAAARRHLDEADVKDQRTRGNEWGFRVWLRGQLLLAEGSPTAAAAHFEQLATHSLQALPDGGDLGWRARFGQGQAARALADLPQAAAHFDAALALLDRVSRRAALRGGQATFLDSRRDLVNAALELHL